VLSQLNLDLQNDSAHQSVLVPFGLKAHLKSDAPVFLELDTLDRVVVTCRALDSNLLYCCCASFFAKQQTTGSEPR
jgi:hypothetical protein